jgi:plasmid maintenance system antidote protein VapI
MKLTKDLLEELYSTMSLEDIAEHLGIARSTVYYHMCKLGVKRRSKSEAQKQHLTRSPHQRSGKNHTDETKSKISNGTRKFWDSNAGQEQKRHLGELRRKEWDERSNRERSQIIHRLQSAERPSPGELSRFGEKLAEFLSEREEVSTGITLTSEHISDIILTSRKVVIELLLPIAVYGSKQQQKVNVRYDRLIKQLNDSGYRVVVIEDVSNTISIARCQRVYDQLLDFFDNTSLQYTTIIS